MDSGTCPDQGWSCNPGVSGRCSHRLTSCQGKESHDLHNKRETESAQLIALCFLGANNRHERHFLQCMTDFKIIFLKLISILEKLGLIIKEAICLSGSCLVNLAGKFQGICTKQVLYFLLISEAKRQTLLSPCIPPTNSNKMTRSCRAMVPFTHIKELWGNRHWVEGM